MKIEVESLIEAGVLIDRYGTPIIEDHESGYGHVFIFESRNGIEQYRKDYENGNIEKPPQPNIIERNVKYLKFQIRMRRK